jgi:hypothetical protein
MFITYILSLRVTCVTAKPCELSAHRSRIDDLHFALSDRPIGMTTPSRNHIRQQGSLLCPVARGQPSRRSGASVPTCWRLRRKTRLTRRHGDRDIKAI